MRGVRLKTTFPKHNRRGRVAVFEWTDGVVATTPIWGKPDRLPHDLGHFTVEARFRPPYGFWALAGQQAPFGSLTLVRGAWPKGKREWLERAMRKHGAELLKTEATGFGRLADPDFDIDESWPTIKRSLQRSYRFVPENAFANVTKDDVAALRNDVLRMQKLWRSVPTDGALVVHWPPERRPEVVREAAITGQPLLQPFG